MTTTTQINPDKITRHSNYIKIALGITATEGSDGNLPSLLVRKNGRKVAKYRGSSLVFGERLTDEDRRYLASLATAD